LALLALTGGIRGGHLAVGGGAAGIVWASELAVRRRMIGEVVPPERIGAAVAFDSLTNSIARVLGPLCGGVSFESLGLGGAYLLAAALYLTALLTVLGLDFPQARRRFP